MSHLLRLDLAPATSGKSRVIEADDRYGPVRKIYRRLVHLLSYHFILRRQRRATTRVAGFDLVIPPTVFHPKIFLTSAFFAQYLQSLDLRGRSVIEIGTGSGILSLSAAKAGASSVLAVDINPAAVAAANDNAKRNGLHQVKALQSNLFSSVPEDDEFDIVISSPPSFSGEPRDATDRAWHAGPGYRDILPLFDQAAQRLRPGGKMYLLLSSDTNIKFMEQLIASAGFISNRIKTRSIWVEAFHLYELTRSRVSDKQYEKPQLVPSEVA